MNILNAIKRHGIRRTLIALATMPVAHVVWLGMRTWGAHQDAEVLASNARRFWR